ncbi:helix-turn-helix domain-containing protein [Streptomyces sp. ISL-36]|uniref:PucR family transcriptional regulator n=1 Tax=Streptomyces sp. ISL-36 TaxID=2819182 RepID=UPI001BE8ECF6|nr:helix-turn-helix domain-containing protein [Streptomyces sp. ISL-36]MBT2442721.1 helix-turn-helix domain-containing protein [Streptomyces sp. ISL-36]
MPLPNTPIREGAGDGSGEELFALADAIAAVIGGSVAIEDLDARVLAYSTRPGQRIDELRRQGILGRRVPDQSGPQAERQQRQYRQVLAATGVVRLPGLAEDELPRAAVAIRAGDLPLGTIWAIVDGGRLDAAGEQALLEGALTAALHMLRRRGAVALELHAREEALRAGLDGTAPAPEIAYRLGLPARSPLTLLGFAPAGTSPPAAALLARTGSDLGRHWAAVRPSASVATGPRAVYALLPGEDPASARRLAEQALAAVARPRAEPLRAAVSRTGAGLADLAALRAEVDDVLQVITADETARPVAMLTDVHAHVLLAHLADELERRPRLRHPGVEAMLEHDRVQHTHYAASVTAWLDAVGNVGEAARRLTIHQNTLKYRLRRARELFGLDLDDPDDRLSCWLQLRIGVGRGSAAPC